MNTAQIVKAIKNALGNNNTAKICVDGIQIKVDRSTLNYWEKRAAKEKKPKFTFNEHVEVGAQIKNIRTQLFNLSSKINKAYCKTHKVNQRLHHTIRSIDKLRCILDDCVFSEYSELDYYTLTHVYYGNS